MPARTENEQGTDLITIILDAWDIMWTRRIMAAVLLAFVLIPITILAALKPYYYQASAQAMIVEDTINIGSSPLGALQNSAAIFGFGSASSTRTTALALLNSRKFTAEFLQNNNLLPVLFPESFLRDGKSNPEKEMPLEAAVELFKAWYYRYSEDKATGLITVKIKWTDPQLASAWTNAYLEQANISLRTDIQQISDRKIAYLEEKIAATTIVEVRNSLVDILQMETKKSMLVDADPSFPIRVVDPGRDPFETTTTVTTILLLGLLVSLVFAVIGTLVLNHLINVLQRRKNIN